VFHRLHLADPTPLNIALVLACSTVASAAAGVIVYRVVEKPLLEKMMALWRRRGETTPAALGV
jgi:peptidoglycan/LPS O-acetylase OafA/YrhL